MNQGQIVIQGILGDLMAILVIPVIITIMVVVTIKDRRSPAMIHDVHDSNESGLTFKTCAVGLGISLGIWVVLIAVGYLFIRWAGR